MSSRIVENVAAVRAQIATACARAGRDPHSVTLVAITKHRTSDQILAAYRAGVTDFGENRVEEASPKIPTVQALLPTEAAVPTWHMVGHVQSRKARSVVQDFAVIHSLDSVKLARRYHEFAESLPKVLLQVNVSGEESKSGIEATNWEHDERQRQQIWETITTITGFSRIKLVGLMTMAPYYADPEATRPLFASLRRLQQVLVNDFPQITELSMGMTNDYPVAVDEGATMVRVGRAIFDV